MSTAELLYFQGTFKRLTLLPHQSNITKRIFAMPEHAQV
jgi:hypothetical protein